MAKKLQTINYSKGKSLTIRLKGKRLANDNISLYIESYLGYSKDNEKLKLHRKKEYLKIYLIDPPKTSQDREKNAENLMLAQKIRSNRESDICHEVAGITSKYKSNINFFDYCKNYISEYSKKDIRVIESAVRNFKEFLKVDFIKATSITTDTIIKFEDYLQKKYNGETPHTIFSRFKKILMAATNDGLFTKYPANNIKCKKPNGIRKEILMPEDIIKLYNTKCSNNEIFRGFFLCLNTGLRYNDLVDLKYKHIINNQIKKHQNKTDSEVIIDLNENALMLIGEIKNPEDTIFKLPSLTGALKNLKKWTQRAGIERNVTWHSSRHSFATNLLLQNVDIKTVGSLLGHNSLDHTTKYLHTVDSIRKSAVELLTKLQ